MNTNKPVVYIETFNTNNENKDLLGKVIYNYNISDAEIQFDSWISNLNNNSFRIISFNYPCSITLTVYDRSLSNDNEANIVCLLMIGKLNCEKSYKLNNDLENIADIIPMVTKISNGDITHFTDKNIMVIFDQLMHKLDTKL